MQVDTQIGLTKSMYAFVASIMRIACSQLKNGIHNDAITSALFAAFNSRIYSSALDYDKFTTKVFALADEMEFDAYYGDSELVGMMMLALQRTFEDEGMICKISAWQMAG